MKTFKGFIKEGSKEEYQKLFNAKLKKYGVDSPEDLSDEEKKKFFDEIDKEWKADHEEKKESLVKEYIKKDGARRRCAGGDGRRTKKKVEEEEDCEDDEEMEESSMNEGYQVDDNYKNYKKGDKVEVYNIGKRKKEVWVPGVVDGFENKDGVTYLEITYTKTIELRKGEIIRKGVDGILIDPAYELVKRKV